MYRRILTVTLITFGVLAAGGAAFAVANSVSTKPEPAFISHFDKSITDHPTPNTVDDHGHDAVTSPTTDDSTPTTIDDRGNHRLRRTLSTIAVTTPLPRRPSPSTITVTTPLPRHR